MFTALQTAKGKKIFVNSANITTIESYNNTATSMISFGQGRAVAVKGTPDEIVHLIEARCAERREESRSYRENSRVRPGAEIGKYERAVLSAALADIDTLAAPRNIDAVCAVLGIDVASFAKKGRTGMKADIESAIADRDAASSEGIRQPHVGEMAHQEEV